MQLLGNWLRNVSIWAADIRLVLSNTTSSMMRLWLYVRADAAEGSSNKPAIPAAVKVIHPANSDFIALSHPLAGQAVIYVVGHIFILIPIEYLSYLSLIVKCLC